MDPITTLLSVPAIIAIVQLLKSFGVAGKYALLAAVLIPVAGQVIVYEFDESGLLPVIAQGILLGLAAAGVYDAAKVTTGNDA